MSFGRRFGIDFGGARIGIAICDPDGIVATPLVTLPNNEKFLSEFRKLQDEYLATGIFLGKPQHLSGASSAIEKEVEEFAKKLSDETELPITWVDERLTSNAAALALRERGMSARESKGLIDQLAAVAILELGISLEKKNA